MAQRFFKHWLKAYVDYTRASESPTSFHFWTGVSTLAGALQRRVWHSQLIFQWTPNFYIILVAPAGVVAKSTSIDLGMNLLRQVEDIHFGPESLTWQALGESFMEAGKTVEYWEDGEEKSFQMSALTIPISELGTFLNMDDTKFTSFITTMWDGREQPFQHRTRSQELINIKRPWLNIIGATTPSWIRNNIPEAMIGEGLMSRVLFVFAEQKRHLTAYPSKIIKSTDYYEIERRLVADLQEIAQLVGHVKLSDEAMDWGEIWYAKHNGHRPIHMASERYGGYLARKQGHLHKLAMILSVAQSNELVIEKRHLEEAEIILTEAEGSMIRVFDSMGGVDEARRMAEIVQYVRTYNWISPNDLYRLCHNTMSQADFKSAVKIAIEGEMLKVELKEGKQGLSANQRSLH